MNRNRGGRVGGRGRLHYHGFSFSQHDETIPSSWILLDTCSTCSVTNNNDHISNISACDPWDSLQVVTNGGGVVFKKWGVCKYFPLKMYYNNNSMATILSFKEVADIDGVNIRYNFQSRCFIVTHKSSDFIFWEWSNGIYAMDTKNNTLLTTPPATCTRLNMLHTVAQNKLVYTRKEVQAAEKARKLQEIIGWPGTSTFKEYISLNSINNCPITVDDVKRAEHIFGPPLPLLKGATRPHSRMHNVTRVPLPAEIASKHSNIQIFVDFFM